MIDEPRTDDDLGGESSCYAHLICPDCGVVLPSAHLASCQVPVATFSTRPSFTDVIDHG